MLRLLVMPDRSGTRASPWVAFVIALVMNLTNLWEPLAVDDVCHQYYAEQVSKDPLHPFEFDLVWHQKPVPAWDVMVAPVNSYYWAPAILLFGGAADGSTVGWKLWYLPVQFLFCWSLLLLLRRVAPRQAHALLAMLALGPAVLPGLNLMLEVPVLSLGFTSLVLLLRACDRQSLLPAALGGLVFGLAFQTKYSAMGFFGPWLLVAVFRGGWRQFAVGLACAVAVALGIEGLVSLSHGGGSYFLRQLELTQIRDWVHNVRGMYSQVGMLAAPVAFLALTVLGAPSWTRQVFLLLFATALVVVAMVHKQRSLLEGAPDAIAYLILATATWSVIVRVLYVLVRRALRQVCARGCRPSSLWSLGLACWVPGEVLASFVVSPFPAARRSMLVVIAFTFAVGWLMARRRGGTGAFRRVVVASVVLGFCYQGVDLLEGRAVTRVATEAVALVRAHAGPGAEPNIYFSGGWAFEFYAPRAGMKPFLRGVVEAKPGDYVVLGSIDGGEKPWFDLDSPEWKDRVEDVGLPIEIGDFVPFSMQFNYYSGRRPIDGQRGARYHGWVYRVKVPFHTKQLPPAPEPFRVG